MRTPRPRLWPAFAYLLGAGLTAQPVHAEFVGSTSQVCTGNAAGMCETAPTVVGRGAMADMSRFWSVPSSGYTFAASTSITTDYAAIAAFARASGTHTPPPEAGPIFLGNDMRIARSFATFNDVLTAGTGGGNGFLRIPLRVTGSTFIEWQNGAGSASANFACVSSEPGSPYAIGQCQTTALHFTTSETFDTVVDLDIPIVLGAPFEYSVNVNVGATTGYGYGDSVPFTGEAEITLDAFALGGAVVLDVSKQPIPDAPISLGESGFDYQAAPEAPSLLAGLAAFVTLAWRRGVRA